MAKSRKLCSVSKSLSTALDYRDYYQILSVERDATQDEIKRAYRKLARKFHPDVSREEDAETKFKEVGEAYEVLKDPEKRAAYDQLGSDWQSGQDFQPPPGWDQGFEFHGGGFTNTQTEDFSDFFTNLFGGAGFEDIRQRDIPRRGEDTHAKVLIDLQDAYEGGTRQFSFKHVEVGADGRPAAKERTLKVNIPKGVRQGQHIRLAKQGGKSLGNAQPGDLYLEIDFAPSIYRVEGADVYLKLPVAPWEAMLGATIKMPTPAGDVELKVPENSFDGKKLRLAGRGIPSKHPGDFYAVLHIALPPADSPSAKSAYRQFADALDFDPRAQLGG